jgi:hypothetical protein
MASQQKRPNKIYHTVPNQISAPAESKPKMKPKALGKAPVVSPQNLQYQPRPHAGIGDFHLYFLHLF